VQQSLGVISFKVAELQADTVLRDNPPLFLLAIGKTTSDSVRQALEITEKRD
jgi:hypothetical protein